MIVCKVPYPYLGDKQVAARAYTAGGNLWYQVATIRSLVQMTGRGVRHEDDHCATYLLDGQFMTLWQKSKSLFPKWWAEALDFSMSAIPKQTTKEIGNAR